MPYNNRLSLITACLMSLLFLNCTGQNKDNGKKNLSVTPQRSVVYLDNWSIYHPGSWSVPNFGACPTTTYNGALVNDTAAVIDTMRNQLNGQIAGGKITHINYGFARFNTPPVSGSTASYNPANSEYEIYFTDAWADAGPGSWNTGANCKMDPGLFPSSVGDGAKSYGGLYCAMSKLKAANSGLKVLISIGGWGYPDGERTNLLKHFQDVAADALAIQNGASFENSTRFNPFVTSIKKWMTVFGFDGVDIDWEYPFLESDGVTPLTDTELAAAMVNWQALFTQLRVKLGTSALITTAFSPRSTVIKQFAPALNALFNNSSLDFLNMMSYDYYGAFDKTTGVNAPFLDVTGATPNWSFKDSVDAFAHAVGATNLSKLNAGLAAYGRSFSNVNATCSNEHGLGCSFSGAGPDFVGIPSSVTAGNGSLKFWEILRLVGALDNSVTNCQSVPLSTGDSTPMMLCKSVNQTTAISGVCSADVIIPASIDLGNIFIGYDNVPSIKQKSAYARSQGLGGSMMWTITGDDVGFPLLNAATSTD